MKVRNLLKKVDEARVIARAIHEDGWKADEVDAWIKKYYAQLQMLKSAKLKKSDAMCYLTVDEEDHILYGDIGYYSYDDIVDDEMIPCSVEELSCDDYASLYVPKHTIKTFGTEVVAAEILREYGWDDYDEKFVCPDDVADQIASLYQTIESGLFYPDKTYLKKCREEFRAEYEKKHREKKN